jgi:putative hemolysin
MVASGETCETGGVVAWPGATPAGPFDELRLFTYVDPEDPPLRQRLIRLVETLTGRGRLVRRCRNFLDRHPDAARFWADLPAAAGVELQLDGTALAELPSAGPLVVVANHPFGVFDGMLLGSLVACFRSDFLLMTNARLRPVAQVASQWLPIDVEDGSESFKRRTSPMLRAVRHLRQGGCVIIFPSGAVATTPRLLARRAEELPWAKGLGMLLRGGKAGVLPVFFHGQNSLLFQAASHVSMNLRLGLLLREAAKRLDRPMRITVGRPLAPEELPLGEPDLPARLRSLTLALEGRAGQER